MFCCGIFLKKLVPLVKIQRRALAVFQIQATFVIPQFLNAKTGIKIRTLVIHSRQVLFMIFYVFYCYDFLFCIAIIVTFCRIFRCYRRYFFLFVIKYSVGSKTRD